MEEYDPTIEDIFVRPDLHIVNFHSVGVLFVIHCLYQRKGVEVDGKLYLLDIFDTAPQEVLQSWSDNLCFILQKQPYFVFLINGFFHNRSTF
jgi:hypothetical protein